MLIGLQQQRVRPLLSPDDATQMSGHNTDTTQVNDPPTLISPPPASAPTGAGTPAPTSAPAGTPARKPRAPRAPKPVTAPPEQVVTVSPKVQNVVDKIEDWPKPGGLVLLLVIIAIFLFAIVPVSGKKTRLRLLWDTVRGTTSLPDPTQPTASASNGVLPGGIDNTPVGVAPTLSATGTGSPLSPAMTAAAAGMSATASSGYEANEAAYPDAWLDSAYPQGYPGETEYIVPDFPEY